MPVRKLRLRPGRSMTLRIRIVAPTAPVLGATVFANNIQLNWYNADYPGDIAQFKLERANDAGGTPGPWVELATIANPNNNFYHEYTDPGRRLDQTYWYRVRAINWLGSSPFSLPVSATIVRPAPPVDCTPGYQGLPGGVCHCPHYGYVFKGRLNSTRAVAGCDDAEATSLEVLRVEVTAVGSVVGDQDHCGGLVERSRVGSPRAGRVVRERRSLGALRGRCPPPSTERTDLSGSSTTPRGAVSILAYLRRLMPAALGHD